MTKVWMVVAVVLIAIATMLVPATISIVFARATASAPIIYLAPERMESFRPLACGQVDA